MLVSNILLANILTARRNRNTAGSRPAGRPRGEPRYRLELLAALVLAGADQGICMTLLGDSCEVRPSVHYPPVKAMAAAGLVQTTGRVRSDRRVLCARNPGPAWGVSRQVRQGRCQGLLRGCPFRSQPESRKPGDQLTERNPQDPVGIRFSEQSTGYLNTYLNNGLYLNNAARRVTFCVQDQVQESRGQWWPGPHSLRDLTGCGPVFLAGQRGSAGGVAFPDLGGKGLDGGEGEVGAVAEDGVTRPGKSHEAGGAGRQLAG
jgi:hypothetical protein